MFYYDFTDFKWIDKAKDSRKAFILFEIQLILNVLWSFLFFGLKFPLYGLIDILSLLAAITLTILFSYKTSVLAAILLIPYLVWVSFAIIQKSIFEQAIKDIVSLYLKPHGHMETMKVLPYHTTW